MTATAPDKAGKAAPSQAQAAYLTAGLNQPGGKLPLFDADGQAIDMAVIRTCVDVGWAEPWFSNPLKPEWLVCRLTDAGRAAAEDHLRRQR